VAEIVAAGGEALFVEADVSRAADVERGVAAVLKRFGRIDVLFNHAGTVIVRPFLDTTEEDWDRLMAINVKSMFLVTRAVLPSMLVAGRGVIVNTGSISGFTASPMEAAYCVTKGAVMQLTRSIAVEFRDRGIRCNAVLPGFIRTPHGLREMDELLALGIDASEAAIGAAQGRICEPDEVARVALFLASDGAAFINGEGVVVDNASTVVT
jgi:NAD(P)-dependent dehydrogenase (short-subunit alcohol dehydrogenase family)